ncbi:DUF4144 family protein [Shewanella oncorhynchi]|uniref:DUF4144 family protein n=1 Tax=Shewanella oncorhynchi TaxID=2726434 RepID=UPI003D7BBAFC
MTSVKMSSIEWPAIVKLTQNDELLYLEHQRDWLELACLYQHHFIETDQLLDSKGQRYLTSACPQKIHEDPVGELPRLLRQKQDLPLNEFIKWVQNHAQALGQCCVAKLAFTTIAQGIEIVRTLDE